MKLILSAVLMVSGFSSFAQTQKHRCANVAAKQAQMALNKSIVRLQPTVKSAQLDLSAPIYFEELTDGSGGIYASFEGRLNFSNKKFNSDLNDMIVRLVLNKNCTAKSVTVDELSRE